MPGRFDNLKNRLLPDPALPLEQRLFHGFCLMAGGLSLLVVMPVNALQDLSPWVNPAVGAFGLAALWLAWECSRGRFRRVTLILASVALLDLLWFENGGSQGSVGLFFFAATFLVVLFLEGAARFWGLGLLLADIFGLYGLEKVHPAWVVPFRSAGDRLLDHTTDYGLCIITCAMMVGTLLAGFRRERARLEETVRALRESEERHRLLADNAMDVIWTMDLQGRFTYMSPSVERLRGFKAAEVMRQGLEEVFTPDSLAKVNGALGAAFAAIAAGSPIPGFRSDLEQLRQDGTTVWTDVTASVIRDDGGAIIGLLGVTRDLSERKELEASLKDALQFNDQILHCAREGVIVYGADLRYRVWNTFMENLTGLPASAVLGRHPLEVFPFVKEAGLLDQLERTLAGGPEALLEFRFEVPATGREGWASDVLAPLRNSKGELIGVIGLVRDISESRAAELENAKLQAHLQVSQRMESLSRLAGGVAHHLNNVLGAILGFASANLEAQPQGSPAHRAFDKITRAATRGGSIVKSMLGLVREGLAEALPLDLNGLLEGTARMLESSLPSGIVTTLVLAEGLPMVNGDAGALTHAFTNLCTNAAEAMPDGGTLTLETRNLDDGWVELRVKDTGTGMTEAVRKRALDPFFTTKEVGKGTGLGLSMVYSTVQSHHGRMEIQSAPGLGTTVSVRFPPSI